MLRNTAHRSTLSSMTILMILLMLWCWCAGMSDASAAPVPAGTAIDNIAKSFYVDSTSKLPVTLTSQRLHTVVQPQEALSLTNNQNLFRTVGAPVVLAHRLTNNGNFTSSYTIKLSTVGGSSFSLINLNLINDQDGTGIPEQGEAVIPNGGTVTLAPGASISILISGNVPATNLALGLSTQLLLTATSQAQNVTVSNTDTVTVANGASLVVNKSASTATPLPGGSITYNLQVINNGNMAAAPATVTVNGNTAALVLLRDNIPANTIFSSIVANGSSGTATVLYHKLGDPSGQYVTIAPAPANIDGVAWAVPSLASGAKLSGSFSVTVLANASGSINNTAYADYVDTSAGPNVIDSIASNAVQLALPALPSSIDFYNPNYNSTLPQTNLGVPLFVQVTAPQCNIAPNTLNTVTVQLNSKLTGDIEDFKATETGLNTGLFRIVPNVPTADAATHPIVAGDGIVETLKNDTITATVIGCGDKISATILVQPSGVVFDSKTNLPISGATVQLIDISGPNNGIAGTAANAIMINGAPAPNSEVTGTDGSFSFPQLAAAYSAGATFKIVVTPPAGYSFPSKVAISTLPPSRIISSTGSFGNAFQVNGQTPQAFDVPLDLNAVAPTNSLLIEKIASKSLVEIGDFVDYSITIKNTGTGPLSNIQVADNLPAGFSYQRGTARLNGAVMANPVSYGGGSNSALNFVVGAIGSNAQVVLTYRLRVGPGAQQGDGVNRAQASAGTGANTIKSNQASVKVQISQGGVFSDRAYLFGKVYADCNANQQQDDDEPGIPGVRVLLEDGTSATTDEEGKYSLYGLLARTHVAKIDPITLPAGAVLEVLANRNAGDPGSRFVDLKNGEMHKADFAISNCTDGIRAEISKRGAVIKNANQLTETASAARALLTTTATTTADPRTLPASGRLDAKGIATGTPANNTATDNDAAPANQVAPLSASQVAQIAVAKPEKSLAAAEPVASLESLMPQLDSSVAFINLQEGQVLPVAQTMVRVKGGLGAQLHLSVNGVAVEMKQVGQQSSLPASADHPGVTAWEYIGVNLKAGTNTLSLTATDNFGNQRGSASVHVMAPGNLAHINIDVPKTASADGRSAVLVHVSLTDKDGTPVTARTEVKLVSTLGQWQATDDAKLATKNTNSPQLLQMMSVMVEGGEASFTLLPPNTAGSAEIKISSDMVHSEAKLDFMPELRPMLAAGVLEGVLNLRNLNPNALSPTQSGETFEREIQSTSQNFDDGKANAAARGAMYFKGKIDDNTLLTLSFDSDKPGNQTLFRDIQPEDFYPVYGDSSERAFDAQSTSRLYARLDNGMSYAMYGDFSTQSTDPARTLSQYNRALNGVRGHAELGPFKADGFASYTSSTQVTDEIPGNGTSGPYQLSSSNGLVNSEQVHILTRDRYQTAIIISDVMLTRFVDYEMEPLTGQILFKAPVPSLDANLNPISIKIIYEVDNGGPKFWVGGGAASYQLTHGLTVGAAYIHDGNPQDRKVLSATNFTYQFSEKTAVTGEVAKTDADVEGTGTAQRVEFKHEDQALQVRVYEGKTDVDFSNTDALLNSGRAEYGAKAAFRIDENNRIVLDAIRSEDEATQTVQQSGNLTLEHSLPNNMKLEAGIKNGSESSETLAAGLPTLAGTTPNLGSAIDGNVHYTSLRAKLSMPVPFLPTAIIYGEYEHAIDDSGREIVAVGGSYNLPLGGRLYFRHEFLANEASAIDLSSTERNNTTVFGIDTDYTKDGHVFNEYRVADAIDGRTAETAVGLRNLWRIAPGVRVTTTAENIKPIAGADTDKSTALTAAIDYTANPDWKGSARTEWRQSSSTDSYLGTVGAAFKLDDSWTFLSKGLVSLQQNLAQDGTTPGDHRIARAQLGFAFRPVGHDAWNALFRMELKRDQDNTLGAGLDVDETADILSTNINYQASRSLILSGRYGIKYVVDNSNGLQSRGTTQIVGGRAIWDVNQRWDAGVAAFTMFGNGSTSRQNAIGGEVGYLVTQNMWASVGYNVLGFTDKDLAGSDYTQRGIFLRLRFKFDENLFKAKRGAEAPLATLGSN